MRNNTYISIRNGQKHALISSRFNLVLLLNRSRPHTDARTTKPTSMGALIANT